MAKRNKVILIEELPKRSKNLVIDEVQNIFGGCGWRNGACNKDSDCCNSVSSPGSDSSASINVKCQNHICVWLDNPFDFEI
jgi:hypothetical protein